MSFSPLCALLGRLGPPVPTSSGLLSTSAPRRVPTMPVVGVLLWATLLTLGWRATHAKDHGFATPRVQLSFKGKSLAEGVGEQGGTPRRRRGRGLHRSRLLLLTWGRWGAHQQAAPPEISMGIHTLAWLSSQSAPLLPVLGGGGAGSLPSPPSTLRLAGGWLPPSGEAGC